MDYFSRYKRQADLLKGERQEVLARFVIWFMGMLRGGKAPRLLEICLENCHPAIEERTPVWLSKGWSFVPSAEEKGGVFFFLKSLFPRNQQYFQLCLQQLLVSQILMLGMWKVFPHLCFQFPEGRNHWGGGPSGDPALQMSLGVVVSLASTSAKHGKWRHMMAEWNILWGKPVYFPAQRKIYTESEVVCSSKLTIAAWAATEPRQLRLIALLPCVTLGTVETTTNPLEKHQWNSC